MSHPQHLSLPRPQTPCHTPKHPAMPPNTLICLQTHALSLLTMLLTMGTLLAKMRLLPMPADEPDMMLWRSCGTGSASTSLSPSSSPSLSPASSPVSPESCSTKAEQHVVHVATSATQGGDKGATLPPANAAPLHLSRPLAPVGVVTQEVGLDSLDRVLVCDRREDSLRTRLLRGGRGLPLVRL